MLARMVGGPRAPADDEHVHAGGREQGPASELKWTEHPLADESARDALLCLDLRGASLPTGAQSAESIDASTRAAPGSKLEKSIHADARRAQQQLRRSDTARRAQRMGRAMRQATAASGSGSVGSHSSQSASFSSSSSNGLPWDWGLLGAWRGLRVLLLGRAHGASMASLRGVAVPRGLRALDARGCGAVDIRALRKGAP